MLKAILSIFCLLLVVALGAAVAWWSVREPGISGIPFFSQLIHPAREAGRAQHIPDEEGQAPRGDGEAAPAKGISLPASPPAEVAPAGSEPSSNNNEMSSADPASPAERAEVGEGDPWEPTTEEGEKHTAPMAEKIPDPEESELAGEYFLHDQEKPPAISREVLEELYRKRMEALKFLE